MSLRDTQIQNLIALNEQLTKDVETGLKRNERLLAALEDIKLWSSKHPNGTVEAIHTKACEAIAKAKGLGLS